MHTNSLSAYRELNDKHTRQQVVLKVYLESAVPLTDRQVLDILHAKDAEHYKDMNDVRPRIVELLGLSELTELPYKVKDEETGKSVRVCRISTPREKEEAQLRKKQYSEDRFVAHSAPVKEEQMTLGLGKKVYTNSHLIA